MIDLQIILALIFVIVLCIFLYVKRDKIIVQKLLFPVFYLLMYRTKIGINLMDRIAKRYRSIVQLFGYCSVGIGFVGMLLISFSILQMIYKMITAPAVTESGVVPFVPFTHIPGIGYLPFTHWIIAIFVLAVIHEFSHGVVARAHDIPVKSSGFAIMSVLVPIIPAAFVEPDEKKLQKEKEIVQYSVFAAGPISNVVVGLLFLLILLFVFAPIEARITEPVGFSFEIMNESMPAAKAGITSGMIFTSFNGQKVDNADLFLEKIYYCTPPNAAVTLATENQTFELVTVPRAEDTTRGVIGVKNTKNEVKIKKTIPSFVGKIFFWLKDLFKWLFLANLFVGLANLLPLGIVDGGRMLQTMLHSTMKDKKKANKVWGFIALMFVLFLLFGVAAYYLGNPFMLFK